MFDAVVQKLGLSIDDAFDDAIDRLPAMLDVTQEVDRRANFLLDKILCLLRGVGLIDKLMISRTGP